MKKFFIPFALILFISLITVGEMRSLKTGVTSIDMILDGNRIKGGWGVMPEVNPDVLETTSNEIKFVSDVDSIVIDNLKEWESYNFVILTNTGDSAFVRVDKIAANPFENPNPKLLEIANSGKLSKQQALFDIDALIYGLSQVHPDIFSVCKQQDFFRAINKAKASLPDSLTPMELYKAASPFVAMIGDGHTSLSFPYNSVFTENLKRLPVFVDVLPDRSLVCVSSLDSIIQRGDKVLSINGVNADGLINEMIPYVSGERPHTRISYIDYMFPALFHMLYSADNYEVKYQPKGSEKILSHNFPAASWKAIMDRCPSAGSGRQPEVYSFEIDSINDVAVMDFRQCSDINRMVNFADSMFRQLKEKDISNLIIDIRNNGGGNSGVGDILLRYISPKPFIQMEKSLVRVTPLSAKIGARTDIGPMFILNEIDSTQFIKPRNLEEGHYRGNVYLLTSNKTFSSASSFAWAFKECGMGKVIGEETGGMNVHYGDILEYTLPISKMTATISYKRFWQIGADENDIHGTLPDIVVPASEALETALKLVKAQ